MLSKKDILYIEDDDDNRVVMEALVSRSLDVNIETVTSAEDGIARCEKKLPDIILMDIHLPGMNGIDATRQLQTDSKTRNIPVIAVSADAMSGRVAEALDAGAREFIAKPFKIEDVVAAIEKHSSQVD